MAPTATVCMIAKNEKPYLQEWVDYYCALGFDQIIIYDNDSTDGSDVLLKNLQKQGRIEYQHWNFGKHESAIDTAYEHSLQKLTSDWVLYVDADEYLVLHNHKTVTDFLAQFDDNETIAAIGINWRLFGDSGNEAYASKPIIERFFMASEKDFNANKHFKSFSRVSSIVRTVNRHFCIVRGEMVHATGKPLDRQGYGYSADIDWSVAQINHYHTKTWPEYQRKMARGTAWVPGSNAVQKFSYTYEKFLEHNQNQSEDRSALECYKKAKQIENTNNDENGFYSWK